MNSLRDMPPDETLRDQAIAWHVRLGSDAAQEADWLEFETWLGEAPAHARAYEAVEALWSELDAAPTTSGAGNVVPLRRRSAPLAAWISAVAACLVAAVFVALNFTDLGTPTRTYETAHGERRSITLADGSQLTLNGDSRISVRLGRHARQVTMADAEAVFDVAKDPQRPFLIEAGDRQVRVVGTRFNVLHRDREVAVTVQRGVVEVRDLADKGGPPLARLTPGRTLTHRVGASNDTIGDADPAAAMSWSEGRLIFRKVPLGDVAKVLNRSAETRIVVADAVRDMPVTAVLQIDRDEVMAQRLCDFLPLQIERKPGVLQLGPRGDR